MRSYKKLVELYKTNLISSGNRKLRLPVSILTFYTEIIVEISYNIKSNYKF
jgi:hypothetical protein